MHYSYIRSGLFFLCQSALYRDEIHTPLVLILTVIFALCIHVNASSRGVDVPYSWLEHFVQSPCLMDGIQIEPYEKEWVAVVDYAFKTKSKHTVGYCC